MQTVKLQAGYALMDPAFLRQIVTDRGAASDLGRTSSPPARALTRAWLGETATVLSALAAGIIKGHRLHTAPAVCEQAKN
jgi:hypothetical protein